MQPIVDSSLPWLPPPLYIYVDFFSYLNPLRYFTYGEYVSFWSMLFGSLLSGFWARMISVCFLGLSFYFMARRQNIQLFVMFFFLALVTAYIGGLRIISR